MAKKPATKKAAAKTEKPEPRQEFTPASPAKAALEGLPTATLEVRAVDGPTDTVQVTMSDGRVVTGEPGKPVRVAVAVGFSVKASPVAQR